VDTTKQSARKQRADGQVTGIDSFATTVTTPPVGTPAGLQKRIGWGGWVFFAILVLYAALYYAAIVASTIRYSPLPGNDILWGSLASGGAAAYFNKRRGRPAWRAFVVGLLISCAIGFGPDVASRVQGHRLLETLQNSVKVFDPAAAAKLKSLPVNGAASRRLLDVTVVHALQQAPDEAVLAFYTSLLQMITPSSDAEVPQCAAFASGNGSGPKNVDAGVGMLNAMANLFRAAASNAGRSSTLDVDAARAKLAPVVAAVAPGGVLNDPAKFKSLPDSAQCHIYLDLMKGIHALPPADAALVLRYMSSRNAQ
jgi:hypothetical protein